VGIASVLFGLAEAARLRALAADTRALASRVSLRVHRETLLDMAGRYDERARQAEAQPNGPMLPVNGKDAQADDGSQREPLGAGVFDT
jgi:hypothetical protein